jgi:uncharacterized protein YkwD
MPRRLTAMLAMLLTIVPLVANGTTAVAAPTTAELSAAESRVEALINRRRASRDRRPFRHDARVASLARAKSQDMIDRGYFDHRDRKGHYADYHLTRAGVRFTRVSEIIAWGRGEDVLESAIEAVDLWMHSAPHRKQILSSNNYFGAGLATDGRTWKWTVIFITGRDRTDPRARFTSTSAQDGVVSVRWTGSDPVLVQNTSGLRGFDLERREPGEAWTRVRNASRSRAYVHRHAPGKVFEFRLRARDNAGNISRWTEPIAISVE